MYIRLVVVSRIASWNCYNKDSDLMKQMLLLFLCISDPIARSELLFAVLYVEQSEKWFVR